MNRLASNNINLIYSLLFWIATSVSAQTENDQSTTEDPFKEIPNLWQLSLQMFFWLSIVIVAIVATIWLLQKITPGRTSIQKARPIDLLFREPIGQGKMLCLVRVVEQVQVIGVTSSQISYISTLDDDEVSQVEQWLENEMILGQRLQSGFRSFFQRFSKTNLLVLALIFSIFLTPTLVFSQETEALDRTLPLPELNIRLGAVDDPEGFTTTLQVFFLLTILSLAPSLLIMTTSFTRFIVIFSFLRQGLAIPQIPPNQILAGMALFLTFFVMAPVWKEVNDQAIQPYLAKELKQKNAIDKALKPIRKFMFGQTRSDDIKLMQRLARLEASETKEELPTHVLIPAFIISELTTAFTVGFLLFIPFLVIDMVVASILMAMGMVMLPPASIALPFKILLFILIDGWNLLTTSLVMGVQG